MNLDDESRLFRLVSHGNKDQYSPKMVNFNKNAEERNPRGIKKDKSFKSDAEIYVNPYMFQNTKDDKEKAPSELKLLEPMEHFRSNESSRSEKYKVEDFKSG